MVASSLFLIVSPLIPQKYIHQIKSNLSNKIVKSSKMDKKCPRFWPNGQILSIVVSIACEISRCFSQIEILFKPARKHLQRRSVCVNF